MKKRHIVKQFKSAKWAADADMQAYIYEVAVSKIDANLIGKLLKITLNKRLSENQWAHYLRLKAFRSIAAECRDRKLFVPYIRVIRTGNDKVLDAVLPLIPNVDDPEEHPRLFDFLNSKNEKIRKTAAEVIKTVDKKNSLQNLEKLAKNKRFVGKAEAVDIAMSLGGADAVASLESKEAFTLGSKEIVKQFEWAEWNSKGEVASFIKSIPPGIIDASLLKPLLKILLNEKLSSVKNVHALRLDIFQKIAADCGDKRMFGFYVNAIKRGDAKLVDLAMSLITKIDVPEEHHKLCDLLNSKDAGVRQAGAKVIKEVGMSKIMPALIELVGDKRFRGRIEVLDLLASMWENEEQGLEVLRGIVPVGDSREKIRALKILGDRKYISKQPSSALSIIMPMLQDSHKAIVVQAIISFSEFADEDTFFDCIVPFLDSEDFNLVTAALNGLGRFSSQRAILCVERMLASESHDVRMKALEVLETIGNEEVLPVLVNALGHLQRSVVNRAAEAFIKLSHSGIMDVSRVIVWLLNNKNMEVRNIAVQIAQTTPDPNGEIWESVLKHIRETDHLSREYMKTALVEMGGDKLTVHMVAYLKDPDVSLRLFAADILYQMKDPRSLGALINTAREDAARAVRERAIEAIAGINDGRVIPYVIDIMRKSPDIRLACVEALGTLKASVAAPYIGEFLRSPDDDLRYASVKFLGRVGAADYAAGINALLSDSDHRVACAAKETLSSFETGLANRKPG